MMKKDPIFHLTAIFVFVLVGALSGCKSQFQAADPRPPGTEKGLLWAIYGQGVKDTSYLFGTIHMIPASDFFLPAGTERAIENSSRIYFEIDLAIMEDPVRQMEIMQQSFMRDELSLGDLLSEEDYGIVRAHFEKMGFPIFLVERMKPIFLSVFADEDLFRTIGEDGGMKYYEMELLRIAKEAGVEMKGLEPIEFQMAIMDSVPYREQATMLVQSIKAEESQKGNMDTLIQDYLEGDIEALLAGFSADSLSRYDSLLLISRNHNWIPVMREAMSVGRCFFAVGAGHLPGRDGVIQLLRKEGYTVSPTPMERGK